MDKNGVNNMKARYINPYNEDVFVQGFKTAEIANFNEKQQADYEESLMVYRDLKGVIDTSFEEGKIEGEIEGEKKKAIEVAKRMKESGEPMEKISQFTGLTKEAIENI
jgi:predicted transposase/invertase (TIGR01784 family)